MSYQEQFSYPFSNQAQPPVEQKSGWSGKKKAGVAVGSVAALAVSFFAGTEVGYNNAKKDISTAFESAFGGDSWDTAASGSTQGDTAQTPQSIYPVTLNPGDSVEVPCSMYAPEDGTCMTLTLTEVNPNAICSSSHVEPGRYVALTFDASMPANADPDFSSPFRSSPWSVTTDDKRKTQVRSEVTCDLSSNHLDLKTEFPGYSASGTAWLPVPDNVSEAHFEVSRDHLFSVPLG